MKNQYPHPQQPVGWSIIYHLVPGIGVLLFYLLIKSWVVKLGFQPTFGVLMGFVFVGIPFQLAIILREGFRMNGRISFSKTICINRESHFGNTF